VSTETGVEQSYSFTELHAEVQRTAASLLELGVGKGDRVLIYMPMIPEAAFAMLACARIGRCIAWCSAVSPAARWPPASRTPSPR
jgi:propionyl-CoA synthetase